MARRIEEILFPQCFGLGPWKFVNLVNYWIEKEMKTFIWKEYIELQQGALDWEQPAQECLVIQERSSGIARFCGCYKVLGLLEVGTCMVTVRV